MKRAFVELVPRKWIDLVGLKHPACHTNHCATCGARWHNYVGMRMDIQFFTARDAANALVDPVACGRWGTSFYHLLVSEPVRKTFVKHKSARGFQFYRLGFAPDHHIARDGLQQDR